MSESDEDPIMAELAEQPVLAERTVYGAPRRFDLATMLTVTTSYALMFAIIRACGAPDGMLLWAGGFVTLVGAAQALLFSGASPRAASILASVAFVLVTVGFADAASWGVLMIAGIFWGVPLGYLTGALIGGIFLIADAIRRRIER
ncbi:hypothetical protein Poly24_39090 [Rosistilla carotiformis]|uniref:Uncharacterized protein n=1 Tax=Rosistilla carotiformis TaxID=2528017 RepID=A0A518JXC5_9BACT|nr:hypothetical protein [Rosistilla carotiformis]QDV70190.1 hypothetical protein Poly24_39090 [Rosistilla carotiformis]